MIFWLVYRAGDSNDGSPPYLFGYITNIEVKAAFEETRDDNFYYREKSMKRKDFIILQDKLPGMKIDFFEFETKDGDSLIGTTKVKIPALEKEAQRIYMSDDEVFNRMGNYTNFLLFNVKSKYKKRLKELLYYSIHHWYSKDGDLLVMDEMDDMSLLYDKSSKIDQMSLFIRYYGDTLRQSKEEE